MNALKFSTIAIGFGLLVLAFAHWLHLDYFYFAGYTILQFIVLATAWNILGGYCGYVNFGSAAFYALGAYASVFMHKVYPLPVPILIVIGGVVSGIVGFGMGYLTLRLRGAFFSIATLALAVVLQTLVVNWDFVGGSRGAYIIRPETLEFAGFEINYIEYLFVLMLILAVLALATARTLVPTAAAAPKLDPGLKQTMQLLVLMETDPAGKVTKAEFMRYMEAEFDKLDKNKDGALDVKELTQSQYSVHVGTHR